MTGARYRETLDSFLIPELQRLHIPLHRVWFQQDGATPHTTRGVLDRLEEVFPGKVISKGGSVSWPPRPPDLSPLDFYLWGHLKATVFAQPVRTLPAAHQNLGCHRHAVALDSQPGHGPPRPESPLLPPQKGRAHRGGPTALRPRFLTVCGQFRLPMGSLFLFSVLSAKANASPGGIHPKWGGSHSTTEGHFAYESSQGSFYLKIKVDDFKWDTL